MEKRAQFSILFEDDELYDNFIVYQKSQKTLRPLVLKLLTAYYYNDEVRDLVDGVNDEDDSGVSGANSEMVEYFRQCQESLAMMSVYADGLQDLTEDSIDKFSEFTNDLAEKTGGTTSKETDFGNTTVQLSLEKVSQSVPNQEAPKQYRGSSEDERLDTIENSITYLTSLVKTLVQQGNLQGVDFSQTQAGSGVQEIFDSLNSDSQEVLTQDNIEEKSVENNAEMTEEDGQAKEEVSTNPEDAGQVFDDLISDVML